MRRGELVTFKELRELGVPYARQHIGRLELAGKFPRRVIIGANRIAWVEKEVREWIKAKIEARNGASPSGTRSPT